jgi:hypothetical protein
VGELHQEEHWDFFEETTQFVESRRSSNKQQFWMIDVSKTTAQVKGILKVNFRTQMSLRAFSEFVATAATCGLVGIRMRPDRGAMRPECSLKSLRKMHPTCASFSVFLDGIWNLVLGAFWGFPERARGVHLTPYR